MAIDFNNLLTAEQKRDLLTQRIQQFAAEAYQHELNRQVALSVNDVESLTTSNNALGVLESAISVHSEELEKLDQ